MILLNKPLKLLQVIELLVLNQVDVIIFKKPCNMDNYNTLLLVKLIPHLIKLKKVLIIKELQILTIIIKFPMIMKIIFFTILNIRDLLLKRDIYINSIIHWLILMTNVVLLMINIRFNSKDIMEITIELDLRLVAISNIKMLILQFNQTLLKILKLLTLEMWTIIYSKL